VKRGLKNGRRMYMVGCVEGREVPPKRKLTEIARRAELRGTRRKTEEGERE
jgi:hypothetical protein